MNVQPNQTSPLGQSTPQAPTHRRGLQAAVFPANPFAIEAAQAPSLSNPNSPTANASVDAATAALGSLTIATNAANSAANPSNATHAVVNSFPIGLAPIRTRLQAIPEPTENLQRVFFQPENVGLALAHGNQLPQTVRYPNEAAAAGLEIQDEHKTPTYGPTSPSEPQR